MKHTKPLPMKTRPRCLTCGKPLAAHVVYEVRDIPKSVYAELAKKPFDRQRVKYRDTDGARLRWLEWQSSEFPEKHQATFEVHDGTYGLDGRNHFHSGRCAQIYGEAAATHHARIYFKQRQSRG